jgi:hypothetical protein
MFTLNQFHLLRARKCQFTFVPPMSFWTVTFSLYLSIQKRMTSLLKKSDFQFLFFLKIATLQSTPTKSSILNIVIFFNFLYALSTLKSTKTFLAFIVPICTFCEKLLGRKRESCFHVSLNNFFSDATSVTFQCENFLFGFFFTSCSFSEDVFSCKKKNASG